VSIRALRSKTALFMQHGFSAYVQPKAIRQLDVLKTFADDYLRIKKTMINHSSPEQQALLFLKAIILCDNEAFLKIVKGIAYV
jgi:hypothetical protein